MIDALRYLAVEATKHQELAEKTSRDMTLPADVRAERVAKHCGASLVLKQSVIVLRGQAKAKEKDGQ